MKNTEFEFFIHKFDYILPVHSDNKNLINEQREQVLLCIEQLKYKMIGVVGNLDLTIKGCGRDYEVCIHLVEYYVNALKVIRNKEMSDAVINNRKYGQHSEAEANKINSRFD